MAEWKERGYVPDSDEDEDLNFTDPEPNQREGTASALRSSVFSEEKNGASTEQSNDSAIGGVNNGPSQLRAPIVLQPDGENLISANLLGNHSFDSILPTTAELLESTINQGLAVVHEILSPKPASTQIESESRESSLSPPPSSLADDLVSLPTWSPKNTEAENAVFQTLYAPTPYQGTLRDRKAIQQHPYSLEDAKYRQAWKERGLKPIHSHWNAEPSAPPIVDESQGTDLSYSSQVQLSTEYLHEAMNADEESQSPISSKKRTWNTLEHIDNDDLPDLAHLLHDKTPISVSKLKKSRRKELPNAINPQTQRLKTFDLDFSSSDGEDDSVVPALAKVPRDSIPSPPRSGSLFSSESNMLSHDDILFQTPGALPTPLVSSETRPAKRTLAQTSDHTSSANMSDEDERLNTSSQSEAEPEAPRQFERIQRRIKGVLPASWLKLDIAQQNHNIRKKDIIRSAHLSAPEKGVARRVHGHGHANSRTPQEALFFELANSDEEEESAPIAGFVENVNSQMIDLTHTDDVIEEDVIDAMLPSRTRGRGHSKNGDDRQRRLGDKLSSRGSGNPRRVDFGSYSKTITSQKTSAEKASNSNLVITHKRTKRKHHPRRKTVLDAPDLYFGERSSQPAYLRIAARSARQSAQRSIQAETTKRSQNLYRDRPVEQVQTAAEVHERDASSSHAFTKAAAPATLPSRELMPQQSLQPRNPKDAKTNSSSHTKELDKLKRSTDSLLQRVNQTLPVAVQATDSSSIDNNVLRLSRLRALLPLRNRSGAGQLQTRISEPRPAQLEEPATLRFQSKTVRRVPKRLVQSKLTDPRPSSEERCQLEPTRRRTGKKQTQPKKMDGVPRLINLVFDNKENRYAKLVGHSEMEAEGDIVARSVLEFAHHPRTTYMAEPEKVNGGLISRGLLRDIDVNCRKANEGIQHPACTRTAIQDTILEVPGTHILRTCGKWDDEVKHTFEAIFDDIKTFIPCSHADELAIQKRTKALEDVVEYIEKTAVFSYHGELQQFIGTVTEAISELTRSVNTLLDTGDSFCSRVIALRILNRLLILGSQAWLVNNSLGSNKMIALQPAVESLMLVTCRLAVSDMSIVEFLKRDESVVSGQVDASKHPQAESILVLAKISEIWSSPGNLVIFWDFVAKALNLLRATSAYVRLAQLLAIVWMTSSLMAIDCLGFHVTHENLKRDQSPAYQLILHNLKAFCREHEKEISRNSIMSDLKLEAFSTSGFLCAYRNWSIPSALLEFWFQQYETLWFKGNVWRTPGALGDPQESIAEFIEACEAYFDGIDSSHTQKGRSAKALVYKLIPNRGEIGASGQLGDKLETLLINEIQPIRNLFGLHEMLQTSTPPGFSPRLQPLAAKVNFTTAHDAICRIALDSWQAIAASAKGKYGVLQELSTWIYGMISQAVERFKSAYSDCCTAMQNVRKRLEAMPASAHRNEQMIHYQETAQDIMQHNQESASNLLAAVLESFHDVIKDYDDELSARTLLGSGEIKLLFKVAMSCSEFPVRVANTVLRMVPTYLDLVNSKRVQSPIVSNLLNEVKQLLHDRLGGSEKCEASLVFHLLGTWCSLANSAVLLGYKSWDSFLTPQSSDALDMIVSNENSTDSKTLLYADFVRDHHRLYHLEWRPTILAHWVASLLRQPKELIFDHQLTAHIFHAERETTLLSDTIHELELKEEVVFSKQDILDHRTDIIRNLIRSIYCQSISPVRYFGSKGGMNRSDGIRVLRSIIDNMRENWPLAREDANTAAEYREIVIHVVEELTLYPVPDLKYDLSWFVTSSGFPCLQSQNYYELLSKSFQTDSAVENGSGSYLDLQSQFRQALLAAERSDSLQDFSKEMKQIFLPTAREFARVSGGKKMYSVELAEQARFIESVFPAYIEQAFTLETQRMADTIAEILEYILSHIHLRIDGLSMDTVRPLLLATHPVLQAILKALYTGARVSGIVLKLAGTIFDRLFVLEQIPDGMMHIMRAIRLAALPCEDGETSTSSVTIHEGRCWLLHSVNNRLN